MLVQQLAITSEPQYKNRPTTVAIALEVYGVQVIL